MGSLRRHEGYLLIDNRFGPGVSAEFVRQSGKDAPVVPEGARYESATITCSHCHAVVILNPQRTRPRHYCAKCDHYVCDTPACAVECLPLAQVLDDLQERGAR
jgi:glycerol-3-phosphate cytidylyltransferase-like family protein